MKLHFDTDMAGEMEQLVRVRSNLAHEIAHLVAQHSLNTGWMTDDKCLGSGASQEKEAAELAGALLVPRREGQVTRDPRWRPCRVGTCLQRQL